MSNETRDAIESYLDTFAEKRDVRSETVEMKDDRLKVENKNAADARDDIDEKIPERKSEIQASIENARNRVAEFSTREQRVFVSQMGFSANFGGNLGLRRRLVRPRARKCE